MSTVLWTNLLVDGKVSTDDSDKPALHKHADTLDAISRKLGLGPFSALCDTTDLRFNLDEVELPEGMASTNELMAIQGAWVELPKAVRLLDGLLAHLRANKVRFGLLSNDYDEVVAELAEALAEALDWAQASGVPGARFNFSVVM